MLWHLGSCKDCPWHGEPSLMKENKQLSPKICFSNSNQLTQTLHSTPPLLPLLHTTLHQPQLSLLPLPRLVTREQNRAYRIHVHWKSSKWPIWRLLTLSHILLPRNLGGFLPKEPLPCHSASWPTLVLPSVASWGMTGLLLLGVYEDKNCLLSGKYLPIHWLYYTSNSVLVAYILQYQ